MKPDTFRVQRHHLFFAAAILSVGVVSLARLDPLARVAAASPPAQLTDVQLWSVSRDSSEEDGYFRSDNLLSNDTSFQYVIPGLLKIANEAGVYAGIGPDQNV